jgi:hypothetical protein
MSTQELNEAERTAVLAVVGRALEAAKGNRSAAARALGISQQVMNKVVHDSQFGRQTANMVAASTGMPLEDLVLLHAAVRPAVVVQYEHEDGAIERPAELALVVALHRCSPSASVEDVRRVLSIARRPAVVPQAVGGVVRWDPERRKETTPAFLRAAGAAGRLQAPPAKRGRPAKT